MRIATPDICVFGNTPEVHLIAHTYLLNVAVFEVDPHNPQQYLLMEHVVVDHPNNHENVIYLLLEGNHYQRIITSDGRYSNHYQSSLEGETAEEQGQEPPLDPPLDAIQQDQEPPSNPPQAIPLQVPQTTSPINEITSNDENFYGTFPTLFSLGCGLRKPG